MIPQLKGHAPGWGSRMDLAGQEEQPWAWSRVNGGEDLPAGLGGLCEKGWHNDCPQAPLIVAVAGCCSCPCHQSLTAGKESTS